MGGLGEEQREGLEGVDTDASVGEELRGEGNDGRGMGASRWRRRDRSPRLASSSNIEGELMSRGYAWTYCCPTRGIVLGLLEVGMVGIKGVVGGSEGRRGE